MTKFHKMIKKNHLEQYWLQVKRLNEFSINKTIYLFTP